MEEHALHTGAGMDSSAFETLAEYPSSLVDSDGAVWIARARGCRRSDGLWEAFLEFERDDGTVTVRTSRETTQPNRADVLYWAAGLTPVFLEGAFGRAAEVQPAEHILTASNSPHPSGAGGAGGPDGTTSG